jgi:hypothetical protein
VGNQKAIGGDETQLPEIAHEFGHGVGLNHSWSNDVTYKDCGSWCGGPGEYDNLWDLMSAANIYVDPTGAFGLSGGLCLRDPGDKNGAPRVIRFHALTGAMQLENPMPRPLPK